MSHLNLFRTGREGEWNEFRIRLDCLRHHRQGWITQGMVLMVGEESFGVNEIP